MAEIGSLSFNLVVTVLLLVPGIVSLDLYYITSQQRSNLSRTRLVVYGSGISVFSIFLLFILSPLYMACFGGTEDPRNFITTTTLAGFSLFQIVTLYSGHSMLSGAVGFGAGWVVRSDGADRREPWAYAFDEVPSENEVVDVTLIDDNIVRGKFNEQAFDDEKRELFLEDPYLINQTGDNEDVGRSTMIPENAISFISFSKDPNTETAQSVDEEEVDVDTSDIDEAIEEVEEADGEDSQERRVSQE